MLLKGTEDLLKGIEDHSLRRLIPAIPVSFKDLEKKWHIHVLKYTTTSDGAEPDAGTFLEAIGTFVPPSDAKYLWLDAKRQGKATLSLRILSSVTDIHSI